MGDDIDLTFFVVVFVSFFINDTHEDEYRCLRGALFTANLDSIFR